MKLGKWWYVKSHSNLGKEYIVAYATDNETWVCSCPTWLELQRKKIGECKHIKEIKEIIEGMSEKEILESQYYYPDYIRFEFIKEEEFSI